MSGETNFGDSGAAYLERLEQDRADLIAALQDSAKQLEAATYWPRVNGYTEAADGIAKTATNARALLARLEGRER